VVENAFGILKQTFRELLVKLELQVVFLLDVITCCIILQNILLGQSHEEVEQLLQVLLDEGLDGEVVDDDPIPFDYGEALQDNVAAVEGARKRMELGVYLTLQQ
jgi:predicted RNase H-like HicB family nuclease